MTKTYGQVNSEEGFFLDEPIDLATAPAEIVIVSPPLGAFKQVGIDVYVVGADKKADVDIYLNNSGTVIGERVGEAKFEEEGDAVVNIDIQSFSFSRIVLVFRKEDILQGRLFSIKYTAKT